MCLFSLVLFLKILDIVSSFSVCCDLKKKNLINTEIWGIDDIIKIKENKIIIIVILTLITKSLESFMHLIILANNDL